MENKLKIFRAKHNFSQHKLAQLAGVSRQAINAIETGKYNPSLEIAFKLSEIFNEKIENLFIRFEPSVIHEHHLRSYR